MKITIPTVPLTLNRLLRTHWSERRNQGNRWMRLLLEANCPLVPFQCRREQKARVTVRVYRKKLQDEDNFRGSLKPIFDAMKKLGLIVDDSRQWLEQDCMELKAGKTDERTEIEVSMVETHTELQERR